MKKKIITIQLATHMKKEDIEKLENELATKFGYKVVLLPSTVNLNTLQIFK